MNVLRIVHIYFYGIRDYSLLFPKINKNLAKRLGLYYKEAEKCLENVLWLSYALMCGAIFQGILFSKYGSSKTYSYLIKKALDYENLKNTIDYIYNYLDAMYCEVDYILSE